MLAMIWKSS